MDGVKGGSIDDSGGGGTGLGSEQHYRLFAPHLAVESERTD